MILLSLRSNAYEGESPTCDAVGHPTQVPHSHGIFVDIGPNHKRCRHRLDAKFTNDLYLSAGRTAFSR
jgi:hypothetical protein